MRRWSPRRRSRGARRPIPRASDRTCHAATLNPVAPVRRPPALPPGSHSNAPRRHPIGPTHRRTASTHRRTAPARCRNFPARRSAPRSISSRCTDLAVRATLPHLWLSVQNQPGPLPLQSPPAAPQEAGSPWNQCNWYQCISRS